ncbi:hypothetical protein [Clostridium tarantellae]|uniref:Uncharacterized protein n=1 Tax=Clostridium tarantellae TaxID=39493 RepID=A0A6I1MNS9_9CLOT|nr:hypothetical protein [Clostridium tarantellae]MPQ44694.1 hypothetical protein [Clostridium tarantellae]
MWDAIKSVLLAIIFSIAVIGSYALLGRYVFNKVKVNKWIILTISVISFIISFFFNIGLILKMVLLGIFVISILWFLDVNKNGYPKPKKDKKVVIKPKAKPNRVKDHKSK